MIKHAYRFLKDDSGATAIEYAVIASLIAVVAVPALTGLGSKLKHTFGLVKASLH
jgi:pilus assembly protein Flp/PilA